MPRKQRMRLHGLGMVEWTALWNPTATGGSFTDNFTDSDSTTLISHTSDSGHGWADTTGGDVVILSNKASLATSSGTKGNLVDVTPSSTDVTMEMTVIAEQNSNVRLFFWADKTSPINDLSYFRITSSGASLNLRYIRVTGAAEVVNAYVAGLTSTIGNSFTARVETVGDVASFYENDILVGSYDEGTENGWSPGANLVQFGVGFRNVISVSTSSTIDGMTATYT